MPILEIHSPTEAGQSEVGHKELVKSRISARKWGHQKWHVSECHQEPARESNKILSTVIVSQTGYYSANL